MGRLSRVRVEIFLSVGGVGALASNIFFFGRPGF